MKDLSFEKNLPVKQNTVGLEGWMVEGWIEGWLKVEDFLPSVAVLWGLLNVGRGLVHD